MKYVLLTHLGRNNKFTLPFFLVPPTIDPMTNIIIANAGDKVDLECAVAGTPTPIVEWYYSGSYYTGQEVIFKNITLRKFTS